VGDNMGIEAEPTRGQAELISMEPERESRAHFGRVGKKDPMCYTQGTRSGWIRADGGSGAVVPRGSMERNARPGMSPITLDVASGRPALLPA